MEGALLTATARLLESLRDPMDRQVVGPAAVDEIFYRVLRSEKGHVLYDLTRHQTPYSNVAQALERMHRDYQESLTVEELARESAMGVSSFHRAFREVTGDSPVQYLKKIRLLKAKGLLVFGRRRDSRAENAVALSSRVARRPPPSLLRREWRLVGRQR